MNFDFPLILVLASFITGAIWALDALLWAPKRKSATKEPVLVEYAKAFFPVIFIVRCCARSWSSRSAFPPAR